MGLVLTQRAARDLGEIHLYLAEREGAGRADALIADIRTDLERLARFPHLGRAADTADTDTREKILPRLPYRVVYRVRHGQVTILRVLHTARDRPPAPPAPPSPRET